MGTRRGWDGPAGCRQKIFNHAADRVLWHPGNDRQGAGGEMLNGLSGEARQTADNLGRHITINIVMG
jgi:hypothetical protein